MQALLSIPYQQARTRFYMLKQQFHDLGSTPGPHLMPVAVVANTATRVTAQCQLGIPNDMAAWAAQMKSFVTWPDVALTALRAWASVCPKSRFSTRTATDYAQFAWQSTA